MPRRSSVFQHKGALPWPRLKPELVPRFYFHVEGWAPDQAGTELESIIEAKCEAARYAGRLLCEEASQFWENASFTMTVTDTTGLTLFMLTISGIDAPAIQVVELPPHPSV